MLPLQFFGQNFHFAVNLCAALVFFAVCWLYLDAWSNRRGWKEFYKWAGFALLAVASLVHAAEIEQSALGQSILGDASDNVGVILKIAGYIMIIVGLAMDPLQPVPKNKGLGLSTEKEKTPPNTKPAPALLVFPVASKVLLAVGSLGIAFLYFRRATTGLERHLRPVAIAFLLIGVADLLHLLSFWRMSDNPLIFNAVAAFGWVWFLEHTIFLIGVVILGYWVWNYLTKRFQSQLFMIFTSAVAIIFLITTVSFTYLILGSIQKQTLANLTTASNVLKYALQSKQAETQAYTETLSQNPAIIAAVQSGDHNQLVQQTATFLAVKNQSNLLITSDRGKVLLRADDPSRWGDSYSADPLVRRALIGRVNSSIQSKEGVVAPQLYIKTASPIRNSANEIIGVAIVGLLIDNGFVDGIKSSTGLDSSVYSGNVRAATTLLAADRKSRLIGVKEVNQDVQARVLKEGKSYAGVTTLSNRPFLAVYAPLKDIDNVTLGMLQVSQPQDSILQAAGRSIELTFLFAVVLMIVATVPAYVISNYLTEQLK
ncbi:MAG TPA: cache domain-containing protein [Candidatus Saccharimonadia bacterium]